MLVVCLLASLFACLLVRCMFVCLYVCQLLVVFLVVGGLIINQRGEIGQLLELDILAKLVTVTHVYFTMVIPITPKQNLGIDKGSIQHYIYVHIYISASLLLSPPSLAHRLKSQRFDA